MTENLLVALAASRFPLAFEVTGQPDSLQVGIACRTPDRERVVGLLKAHFPEAIVGDAPEALRNAWRRARGVCAGLEFGLAREFMLPLRTFRDFRPDPLLALYATLAELRPGEIGLFQVLFEPAASAWAESVMRAVHTLQGEPFFADDPEFTKLAKEKVVHPFFAVTVRMGVKAEDEVRAWDLLQGMAGALNLLGGANELIALAEEEEIDLEEDLLSRTSHRSGMLLTTPELVGLVHLPGESVRIAKLAREAKRTKAAPREVMGAGLLLGENLHEGRVTPVRLPPDLRTRHAHLVGASGTGKSTLLVQLILEDLRGGGGLAVLDPHGDLVDEILSRFPEEREDDLIIFDPSEDSFRVGWNMLACRTEVEKIILSSDLVGVFRRLSTSWGDQMTSVLGNAIQAFLESRTGGTLLDLRRFLVDRDFRTEFLKTVEDPEVRYYFEREFPLLRGMPQGSILTRLDTFLRSKLVRRVVTEGRNRLDFRELVDRGGVFLAKLAQGAIGEENAALLGSLLVSAFHQAALSRQDLAPAARRQFSLYVDECHHFATPSMAALLSGARKYRLSLTAAHQELGQLRGRVPEVLSALLANAGTRIVFRVGEADARELERGFSYFTAADLVNLGVGEALCRVGRSEADFNLRTRDLAAVAPLDASTRRDRLLTLMGERFPVTAPVRAAEETGEATPLPPAPAPKPAREAPLPPPAIQEETAAKPRGGAAREREVDKLTLDYLALVAASPFLTVRERNRELGLSAWRGQRLKSVILGRGLAREVAINPGGRGERFKLLDLTAEGRALLARYGVPVATGHGRGGIAHQWWAERIASWLAARGEDSEIEDASSGARVDLTFALGAERVAVEIEMGDGHVAENVRKDLDAGYGRVVCLVDQAVNLDRIRAKLGTLPSGVVLGELPAFEVVLTPLLSTSLRRPNQKEEPRRLRRGAPRGVRPEPLKLGHSPLADPGALPTPQAAEYLGLSPATLETLRSRGGGPAFVKLGRRVVYRREDLEAWLVAQRRSSTSDVP
ncbi:MAG TPA: helix-turn-helix domain-containing protein [Thermoanaerobaculia bacterium]|nr:helix-turn-helix domain-containing protein [Thermoanaerobaculia bacterium]